MRVLVFLLMFFAILSSAKAQSLEQTLGYLMFLRDEPTFVDRKYSGNILGIPDVKTDVTIVDNCNVRISATDGKRTEIVLINFSKALSVADKPSLQINGEGISCTTTEINGQKEQPRCDDYFQPIGTGSSVASERLRKAFDYYKTNFCRGYAF